MRVRAPAPPPAVPARARTLFPWSIWAMIQKFLIRSWGMPPISSQSRCTPAGTEHMLLLHSAPPRARFAWQPMPNAQRRRAARSIAAQAELVGLPTNRTAALWSASMRPPSPLQYAAAAGMVGVAAVCVAEAARHPAPFSWHPIAMALAFLVLPAASILLVQARHSAKSSGARCGSALCGPPRQQHPRILTPSPPRTRRRRRLASIGHAALNVSAVLAAVAGLFAIYSNKERLGKEHFATLHSWAGLAAIGLFAVLAVGGLGNVVALRKGWLWRDALHRWSGTASFLAGSAAAALGLRSGWAVANLGDSASLALAVFVVGLAPFVPSALPSLASRSPARAKTA